MVRRGTRSDQGRAPIAGWMRRGEDAPNLSSHRDLRDAAASKESEMLHYAVVFLVIALIAAVLGFGGIAAGAAGIAKILFIVFVILAVATFLFGRNRGR